MACLGALRISIASEMDVKSVDLKRLSGFVAVRLGEWCSAFSFTRGFADMRVQRDNFLRWAINAVILCGTALPFLVLAFLCGAVILKSACY